MRTKGQQKNSTKPLKNNKKRKKYFQKWGGKKGGQSSPGYRPITKDRRQPTGIRTPKKVKKKRENCEKNVVGEQKNEAEGRRGREPSEVVTIVYSLLFITKIQRTKTKSKNKKKNNLLKKKAKRTIFSDNTKDRRQTPVLASALCSPIFRVFVVFWAIFFAHPVGSFFLCLLFLRPHREAKTTPFLSMNSMFRPFLCAIILTCFFVSFRVFFDCFACSFALFFVASRTIFFSFFAPKSEFRVIFLTTFFKTFSHFIRNFVELGCLFVARVGHLFPQCFDFWNCLWIAFGGYPDRPKCEFR